jgi:hypothetical protein
MLLGMVLVIAAVCWPPAGALAGAALLAWGSTHFLLQTRAEWAPWNLLFYAVPMVAMLGAALDLLSPGPRTLATCLLLAELVLLFWLMRHATTAVLAGAR